MHTAWSPHLQLALSCLSALLHESVLRSQALEHVTHLPSDDEEEEAEEAEEDDDDNKMTTIMMIMMMIPCRSTSP